MGVPDKKDAIKDDPSADHNPDIEFELGSTIPGLRFRYALSGTDVQVARSCPVLTVVAYGICA